MSILVFVYAATQFIVFWERTNYTILETNTENVLTEDLFAMKKEDGFTIAAAFVGGSDLTPDPQIGELKFVLKQWGSASGDLEFKELKQRPCTKADFEINDGEQRSSYGFYAMDESTENVVTESGYEVMCIDEPFEVIGDFNSGTAKNLMVTYELCDRTKIGNVCKSEEVINEALKFSYILLIENKESYKH